MFLTMMVRSVLRRSGPIVVAATWILLATSPWIADRAVHAQTAAESGPPAPAITVRPATIALFGRTTYPRSRDDGSVWAGVGLSGMITGGAAIEWGRLSVIVAPEITWSQNAGFVIAEHSRGDLSEWGYPWAFAEIDVPQRPGPDQLWRIHPGQTAARIDLGGFLATVGMGVPRVEPGRRYPLILGNSAPGFPHIDLASTPMGSVTVRLVSGWLALSGYERADASPSYLSMADVRIAPPFLDELEFWLSVAARGPRSSRGTLGQIPRAILAPFSGNSREAPEDLMARAAVRWSLAPGFQVRAEWLRGDFFFDVEDLITEPEYSQAYALGLTHAWTTGELDWQMDAEHASTAAANSAQGGRGAAIGTNSTIYRHSRLPAGHANFGQFLGASIGPGSVGTWIRLTRHDPRRSVFAEAERVTWDLDAFDLAVRTRSPDSRSDQEWTVAAGVLQAIRPVRDAEITMELVMGLSLRRNRNLIPFADGGSGVELNETNGWVDLRLTWNPSS